MGIRRRRSSFRRNADSDDRLTDRSSKMSGSPQDQAAVLVSRIRSRELNPLNVEIAASLGHPAANLVVSVPRVDWSEQQFRRDIFRRLFEDNQRPLGVRVVCDFILEVLRIFENRYPNDTRSRDAINATLAWANDPTEDNRIKAADVGERSISHASPFAYAVSLSCANAAGAAAADDLAAFYACNAAANAAVAAGHAAVAPPISRQKQTKFKKVVLHCFDQQAAHLAEMLLRPTAQRRNNPDDDEGLRKRIRKASQTESAQDEAAVLVARIRSGDLNPANVDTAASLGHRAANLVMGGDRVQADWSDHQMRFHIFQGLILRNHKPLVVRVVCDFALLALPIFETRYPNDARPRQAIDAALRWVNDPTEDNKIKAGKAASIGMDAVEAASDDNAYYLTRAAALTAAVVASDNEDAYFANKVAESAAHAITHMRTSQSSFLLQAAHLAEMLLR